MKKNTKPAAKTSVKPALKALVKPTKMNSKRLAANHNETLLVK